MPNTPASAEVIRQRLRRACAVLDLAELSSQPYAMSQALAEVARCHRELAAEASAENYFVSAVRWARLCGSVDHVADLLCEAADAAVRLAAANTRAPEAGASPGQTAGFGGRAGHSAHERARDRAFEASQLAGQLSDPSCEARLLMRVGELLERCGDHADALQMQLRALDRMGGVAPRDASRLSGFGRLADA
ncbi:MAG: hypothetical protein JNL30_03175 [Rubrivivax sp.]|nr:hypothetical protein [Rubrivivax sp.]